MESFGLRISDIGVRGLNLRTYFPFYTLSYKADWSHRQREECSSPRLLLRLLYSAFVLHLCIYRRSWRLLWFLLSGKIPITSIEGVQLLGVLGIRRLFASLILGLHYTFTSCDECKMIRSWSPSSNTLLCCLKKSRSVRTQGIVKASHSLKPLDLAALVTS